MSKVITAAKQVWSAKDQITRNIWLAGLGAYDKGYESASNTVTKSQTIFDELVERGRKLEADTTQSISSQKDKFTSVSQSATDAIQNKVQGVVTNFTHIDANAFDNIIDKIEQIEQVLAEAKTTQEKDSVQKLVEKVEVSVTEKLATVEAEVTTVVETVGETISDATAEIVAKPGKKVAAAKQTAKKVTNRRVKKAAAKKSNS